MVFLMSPDETNNNGLEKLPSGKRLHNYGKSPFSMGKSTISMAIFNSYVKLPEGRGYSSNSHFIWYVFMVPSELNSRKRGLLIQGWHWKHVQILQTCNIIVEKSGKSRTKSIKMSHLQKKHVGLTGWWFGTWISFFHNIFNGNSRILNWRYLPYIRPM